MKVIFHNYYNSLNLNNKLFEEANSVIGDDLLKPFNRLSGVFSVAGIETGTYTKIPMQEADAFVFIDYPKENDPVFQYAQAQTRAKLYLLILESPIVNFNNFDLQRHTIFEKVFTWADDMVENNPAKYIKINYSFDIPVNCKMGKRERLCTIISGNKLSGQPNELYHERLRCIKWYEKNAPDQLDLYGTNWPIVKFNNDTYWGKLLNRINSKTALFKNNFSVYKGTTERKSDVMPLYKFSICFENVANQRGYITEKIFDCLFSGTIPVYKGANNILDYIPQACFIDYNQFKSIPEMHGYIQAMKDDEIAQYQQNIHDYLGSEQIQQFSIRTFCDTLLKHINTQDEQ